MNEIMKTDIIKSEYSLEEKVFSFLVVFMMLGNVYVFPFFKSLAMGELLFIISLPYFLKKPNKTIKYKGFELLYIFLFYGVIITFLMCFVFDGSVKDVIERILRDSVYYVIIFILGYRFFSYKLFKKYVVYFCVLLSVFIIIQSIVYYISGYLIPGFLLNATLNDGGNSGSVLYQSYIRYAQISGFLKPNGFLCEAVHCAQAFLVALLVLLVDGSNTTKKDIYQAIIISCATVLTMSTSAIIYLCIVWFLFILLRGRKNIMISTVLIILVVCMFLFGLKSQFGVDVIEVLNRFFDAFNSDRATSNSAQLRLFNGLKGYSLLGGVNKLLGIGFGNYQVVILKSGLISFSNSTVEYMNTFSYILVSSGIVGCALFWGGLLYSNQKREVFIYIVIGCMFIVSLGASIYTTTIFIWFMLLILFKNNDIVSGMDKYD